MSASNGHTDRNSVLDTSKTLAKEKAICERKLADQTIQASKLNGFFFDLKARHDAMRIIYERENAALRQLLTDHNIPLPSIDFHAVYEEQYSRLTGHRKSLLVDGARATRDPYSVTCFAGNGRAPVSTPRRSFDGRWSLSSIESAGLYAHDVVVSSVGFSRNAAVLACSFDETVRLYDPKTGERLLDIVGENPAMPPGDGLIPHFGPPASAGGRPLAPKEREAMKGHVRSLAFSPGDELLYVASEACAVTVVDLHAGAPLLVLEGHTEACFSVDSSKVNGTLASAGGDGRVLLWRVTPTGRPAEGAARPQLGLGQAGGESWLGGHALGGRVDPNQWVGRVGPKDREDALRRAQGRVACMSVLKTSVVNGDVKTVPASSVSRDVGEVDHGVSLAAVRWLGEDRLVLGAQSGHVLIADVETGQVSSTWETQRSSGHTNAVFSAAVAPCGRLFCTSSLDNTVKIWDPRQNRAVATLTGHRDFALACAWSPDGRFVLSGSKDRSVCLWETGCWQRYASIRGHNNSVLGVAAVNDASGNLQIASGSGDGRVRMWACGYAEEDLEMGLDFEL